MKKKFDKSVSMLAWGYNEEKLIENFLNRAFALLEENVEEYELVFVNDASTDKTGKILEEYAKKEPRLKIITHEKNLNVGLACRSAIQAATKEYLFWQTVDWAYDLKHFRTFLELLNHFDCVQGIRPVPIRLLSYIPILRSIYRVNSRSDNFKKAVISLCNYYVQRILFGLPFHDFQNITFYKRETIQSVELRGISSFVCPECLYKAYQTGARFIEVPIRFIPRNQGVAKGTKFSAIMRSIIDILKNWLRWGLKFRLKRDNNFKSRIYRVMEPFLLDEEVLNLIVPLFKEYR